MKLRKGEGHYVIADLIWILILLAAAALLGIAVGNFCTAFPQF
jgi:hypothetical protein